MVATGATGAQVVLQQIEPDPSSHVEVDHIVQGRLFVAFVMIALADRLDMWIPDLSSQRVGNGVIVAYRSTCTVM